MVRLHRTERDGRHYTGLEGSFFDTSGCYHGGVDLVRHWYLNMPGKCRVSGTMRLWGLLYIFEADE